MPVRFAENSSSAASKSQESSLHFVDAPYLWHNQLHIFLGPMLSMRCSQFTLLLIT